MADIRLDLTIKSSQARVFRAVTTSEGLDSWRTKRSSGTPQAGATYELSFGPGYDWRAKVTRFVPESEFELEMVQADRDWIGTRVGVRLESRGPVTWIRFHHERRPAANEHFRISCSCWALYLRILQRSLEHGESVPYEERLDV